MEAIASPLNAVLTPLRPHLQPITANLPAPVRDALTSLVGSRCYSELVVALVAEPACLNLALSKALGVGIIALSCVVKLPQLLKIVGARSGAGLSFTALALETASFAVTSAYNFRSGNPVTTYGEAALIAAQNTAIGAAMLAFDGSSGAAATWVAGVAALAAVLAREEAGVPFEIVKQAMAAASFLGVASKLPQIWTNHKQGGTGQLSAFAVFAFLFGSVSRIFTTMQEVDDPIILGGFVAGFALNAVLALQMMYYWNAAPAAKSRSKGAPSYAAVAAGDSKSSAESTGAQKAKSPSTRRRG